MATKTVNLRDLPEVLVRRAKVCAALRGMTLKDFAIEALESATRQQSRPFAVGSAFGGMPKVSRKAGGKIQKSRSRGKKER
jgi:hypothetical protein